MRLKQVTDTASALLAFKAAAGSIPFAEEVAAHFGIESPAAPQQDFGFWASVLHFEMRYRSLDYFLEKTAAPTVLELSAGFSLRGLDYARKHPDASYIDTDLPAIIRQKSEMLHIMQQAIPQNLQLQPLDVLHAESYPESSSELTIINEGLLLYFDDSAKMQILQHIRRLLERQGGTWTTADIYIQHETQAVGSDRDGRWNDFFRKNNVHANYFESFDQAGQFFYDQGFRVLEKYPPEFDKYISLPKLLAAATGEQLELLKSRGKVQETWQLGLR